MSEQWRALAVHVPLARMVIGAMMAFTFLMTILWILSENWKLKKSIPDMWDRQQRRLARSNTRSNCQTALVLCLVAQAILGAVEYVLFQK